MATIRHGSTATGHLVFGASQPIQPVNFNAPKPPDPKPPDPPDPKPPKPPEPHPMPPPRTAGFLTWIKKFVTAEEGGDDAGVLHAIDRPGNPPQQVNSWETMRLEWVDSVRVKISSVKGRFWAAEHANTTTFMDPTALVTCSRQSANPNADSWELFYFIDNGDGTISLRSQFGFYASCEPNGRITCNRTAIGPYEKFVLLPPGSRVPTPPGPVPPGTPLPRIHSNANDPVFRLDDGSAWRLKGVTAFKLAEVFRSGGDIGPLVDAYAGYNTHRVFAYTEGPNWTDPTWDSPTPQQCVDFVRAVNARGMYVWWVLLTSSNPARRQAALDQIAAFTAAGNLGLFLQGANEPERQNPDRTPIETSFMHAALAASGYPWDNGYIDDTKKHAGTFCDAHTKRDGGPTGEWPRRCHDLMDIYSPPADAPAGTVALKMPDVAGEPAKHEDVGASVIDWKGYFGGCAIFGAGAVFHSKSGKFGQLPTPTEQQLAASALMGLNAFPPDATLGTYGRIDGDGLRTYKKTANGTFHGNAMVRIRPNGPAAPEPGWTSLETDHILWKR